MIGDQALIQSAQTLKKNLRPDDVLGRYGGQEFLIISQKSKVKSQNLHFSEVYRVAERCRQALENFKHQAGVGGIQVTCSIGIAFSESHQSALNVINEAALALCRAKSKGRNQVNFA